ncbi:MAG TPA: methyltransferase domain-containing protein [Candidatus Binataceae bacterium]|nr:methyltransferase domain-containing protein [Candidatus Binataceae bacterium]
MFASSRFGKFRARDRILARLKLRGDETVLDVGCGHGLLLIAAAKLLPRGHAVGIDLWSQWQQSGNSRKATLRNAALEGVAQRVSVHDGDMRKMPFADRSFDATVAHFAIHPDENRLNIARLAKQGPPEIPAKAEKAMSPLDELTESIKAAVSADSVLGKKLKFDLKGQGFIYIDGGSVTNENKPADLTLRLSIDDLKAMSQGKLAPMNAIMSGRLSLSDMGVAAALQGKMQVLFSKMQRAS